MKIISRTGVLKNYGETYSYSIIKFNYNEFEASIKYKDKTMTTMFYNDVHASKWVERNIYILSLRGQSYEESMD